MSNCRGQPGFTLTELVVVMGLFSLVLFFSLPLFSDLRVFSDPAAGAGKAGLLIEKLKRDAVGQNRDLYLYIGEGAAGTGYWIPHRVWIPMTVLPGRISQKISRWTA